MNYNRVLETGTKVLIFNDIESMIDAPLLQGVVIVTKKYEEDNTINYIVLGEDGNEYYGSYGKKGLGNRFFLLKRDYIDYLTEASIKLEKKAKEKMREIAELKVTLALLDYLKTNKSEIKKYPTTQNN